MQGTLQDGKNIALQLKHNIPHILTIDNLLVLLLIHVLFAAEEHDDKVEVFLRNGKSRLNWPVFVLQFQVTHVYLVE